MPQTQKRVGIYTLGCKVNRYESEAIAERLTDLGLEVVSPSEKCDAYVINTCTVTAEADRKARQFIRRALSKNPEAKIAVTGCLAQTNAKSIADIGGVHYICGNDKKLSAADAIADLLAERISVAPQICVNDIMAASFEPMSINSFGRTRACVKIEDGCDSKCTYCIIPQARGKIRSKPQNEVIAEVRELTERGCREVVLTGIETASYGRDLDGTNLLTLLRELDRIDGIGRIRLGSLDPSLFKPDFIKGLAEIRALAPHFHLSMQSGSDRILAAMKRKYNTSMAYRAAEGLREHIPGVMFTTDIIVGFPGETEEDFADSCRLVDEMRFLAAHIFAYSRREGTPAAVMPNQVPEQVKRARSAELIARAASVRREILAGAVKNTPHQEVLFETFENGIAEGHTPSFIEVRVKTDKDIRDTILPVTLDSFDDNGCIGHLKQ